MELLENYRKANGLSKLDVARKLGMTSGGYTNMYRRKDTDSEIRNETVEKILSALNLNKSALEESETKDERHLRVMKSLPDCIINWLDTSNGRTALLDLFMEHFERTQELEKKEMLKLLRHNFDESPMIWARQYTKEKPVSKYGFTDEECSTVSYKAIREMEDKLLEQNELVIEQFKYEAPSDILQDDEKLRSYLLKKIGELEEINL